ncbi:maleylpyruvate isomerase family mycothiol-dependent enzyme [Kitasatospora sp. NBC_01539]|uniref:maleylpyruvate isomerase family mycothiol-dependent enzyme n=1 Tax=Kitasatospora sp. NBC_01539 TaxID=2903577 RepID=UPI0038601CA3
MEIPELVDVLRREGGLLAATADRTAPDAPVPTCPEWRLRDLVLHTGRVHRWATALVRDALTAPIDAEGTAAVWGEEPSDTDLVAWFREGHLSLLAALDGAPADLACWSFLPAPSPLAFWARRQAHETAVHRVDAESAAGAGPSPVDPAFAADGLDELLNGFLVRPRTKLRSEDTRTLLVLPTDRPESWLATIGPDPLRVQPGPGPADCTVTGPAQELYLLLWNRRPVDGIGVTGDRSLLELWRSSAQIRWS